jgi:hypothetical protein
LILEESEDSLAECSDEEKVDLEKEKKKSQDEPCSSQNNASSSIIPAQSNEKSRSSLEHMMEMRRLLQQ